MPADRSSWGRFDELQERNNETLREILDSAPRPAADPGSTRRSATTTPPAWTRPRSRRRAPRRSSPLLDEIAALIERQARSPPLVAELHTIGVNPFFGFGAEPDFKDATEEMAIADQGGLGLPDRDYYLKDDAKSVELRTQYVDARREDARAARRRAGRGGRGARDRP